MATHHLALKSVLKSLNFPVFVTTLLDRRISAGFHWSISDVHNPQSTEGIVHNACIILSSEFVGDTCAHFHIMIYNLQYGKMKSFPKNG